MHEQVAQIVERLGEIGRGGRRAFEERYRYRRIGLAEGEDGKQMECRSVG
jgi:hypothetical protein